MIKRYDCYSLTSCYSELRAFSREDNDGDWVSYDDHAEVIEKINFIASSMSHRLPCIRAYPQVEGACTCGLDDLMSALREVGNG